MRVPPGVVAQMVPPGVALMSLRSSLPGMVIRCDCDMTLGERCSRTRGSFAHTSARLPLS